MANRKTVRLAAIAGTAAAGLMVAAVAAADTGGGAVEWGKAPQAHHQTATTADGGNWLVWTKTTHPNSAVLADGDGGWISWGRATYPNSIVLADGDGGVGTIIWV